MATNLIFYKVEHAGQRTVFMLLNVLDIRKFISDTARINGINDFAVIDMT